MRKSKITTELMLKVRRLAERIHPQHNLEGHIIPVVKIALELAEKYDADREIVEVAAYLHDAGRVRFGCRNHDVTGAHYVGLKLWQYGFPKEDSKHIRDCVRTHRSTDDAPPQTIEAKIVANADALSHFEYALYEFGIHYSNCRDLKKTSDWLERKLRYDLENKFTLPGLRDRAEERYQSNIKPLLDAMRRSDYEKSFTDRTI